MKLTADSEDGSRLKCVVPGDATNLNIAAALKRPVIGSNGSSTTPIPGATCKLTFEVQNTGNTGIRVDESSILHLPDGWSFTTPVGPAFGPIAAGATSTFTTTITASEAATVGPITGKLVYTDAPAA